MTKPLQLAILPQPNDTTCGPTCLHAVYSYFGDEMPLEELIVETPSLEGGGTLAAMLGNHALRRGYQAKIYTYNLKVFDPTWFAAERDVRQAGVPRKKASEDRRQALIVNLDAQMRAKRSARLHAASLAYREFLSLGGAIAMEDLNAALIRRYLKRSIPILTGLSATFLYRTKREYGDACTSDDIRGFPCGHFVVLSGYDKRQKTVRVADPYVANPLADQQHYYEVGLDRLVAAILLGVLTYDANLLIIEPAEAESPGRKILDA